MEKFILNFIAEAAQKAGLPSEKVMTASLKDNLTLPRPRLEITFLPASYNRTGRLLAAKRQGQIVNFKTELYEVNLPIAAGVFANDGTWLGDFTYNFAAQMPKNGLDLRGNHVKILITEGRLETKAAPRVGNITIEPLVKREAILHINVTWRVTREETQNLLKGFHLNPKFERKTYG